MKNTIAGHHGAWDSLLLSYGLMLFILHIPISMMILQNPQSLYLGTWDVLTFSLFLLITFLFLPVALAAVIHLTGRVFPSHWPHIVILLLSGLAGRYAQLQISLLQLGTINIILLSCGAFVVLYMLFFKLRKFVFEVLRTVAFASVLVALYFSFNAFPPSENMHKVASRFLYHSGGLEKNDPLFPGSPVFFLSFEKLASSYFLDRNGAFISDQFRNLGRFVEQAEFYPKAVANSTNTVYALSSMYTASSPSIRVSFHDKPTLFNTIKHQENVYVNLEILQDKICTNTGYNCKSITDQQTDKTDDSGKGRLALLIGYYKTHLKFLIPSPLLNQFGNLSGWHFNPWNDMWGKMRYVSDFQWGVMQFELLKKDVLKNIGRGQDQLYVMHNFISDNPIAKSSAIAGRTKKDYAEDLRMTRENLKGFDDVIGQFIAFLKKNDYYENALIVITSDTGYDPYYRHLKNGEEFPWTPEVAGIFLAIKWPGQKTGKINQSVIRQVDFLPTLLSRGGIDVANLPFDGFPVGPEEDKTGFDQRPLHFLISGAGGGVQSYLLDSQKRIFKLVSSD